MAVNGLVVYPFTLTVLVISGYIRFNLQALKWEPGEAYKQG